jgi:hypothetical protein
MPFDYQTILQPDTNRPFENQNRPVFGCWVYLFNVKQKKHSKNVSCKFIHCKTYLMSKFFNIRHFWACCTSRIEWINQTWKKAWIDQLTKAACCKIASTKLDQPIHVTGSAAAMDHDSVTHSILRLPFWHRSHLHSSNSHNIKHDNFLHPNRGSGDHYTLRYLLKSARLVVTAVFMLSPCLAVWKWAK